MSPNGTSTEYSTSLASHKPPQRPVSCAFCRVRKLRCSRGSPCSNCEARGISCQLYADPEPVPQNALETSHYSEILERLRRLEELFISQGRAHDQTPPQSLDKSPDRPQQPASIQSPAGSPSQLYIPLKLQHLTTDVAWLEKLCLGQGFSDAIFPDGMVFGVLPIHQISNLPPWTNQSAFGADSIGRQTRCIWLPLHGEAKIFLDKYINDITYIHHIVHIPSLRAIIDELYQDLDRQTQIKPGQVTLLLSILASVTYFWTPRDGDNPLFLTTEESNRQTALWIKATQDVLDYSHRTTCASLESIQAMIIVSFVVSNLEGISQRYRSLISTSVMMGRELCLHRCDHPDQTMRAESIAASTIQAEIGRRVWWYLVATDWMLSRYAGPSEGVYTVQLRHIMTNKPRNANDEELFDGMGNLQHPLSKPTVMSYFLQRVRLAEVCRNFTDRSPLGTSGPGAASYKVVLDLDAELEIFIRELPSFFRIDRDTLAGPIGIDTDIAPGFIIQRYNINCLIHTQRCKLHLPYLARNSVEPTYTCSRKICLEAAHLIIQTELQLEKERLPFVFMRLKFSAILYGVFMASIVLLLDMCLSRTQGEPDQQRVDLVEAFRILDNARPHSVTAAKLLDSLLHVFRKHKVSPPTPDAWQQPSLINNVDQPPIDLTQKIKSTAVPLTADSARDGSAGDSPLFWPEKPLNDQEISYFNEISQSFDGRTDFDGFDWNTIFSDLGSSFI